MKEIQFLRKKVVPSLEGFGIFRDLIDAPKIKANCAILYWLNQLLNFLDALVKL